MPQFHWSTCPRPVKRQVTEFIDGIETTLEDRLVAAYLHGSLAMAAFNPHRSDVDLLVISTTSISPAQKRGLAHLSLRISGHPAPLEFSVVSQDDLRPWHHPAPFEFHFSESWREQYEQRLRGGSSTDWDEDPATDTDLAAHFMVTHRRGITLAGPPPHEVLPSIPQSDYVHSVISDLVWARERLHEAPEYFVLNSCRVYAYLCQEHVYSKDEAALWALDMLPRGQVALVRHVLQNHRGEPGGPAPEPSDLAHFVDFISGEIRRYSVPYRKASKLVALLGEPPKRGNQKDGENTPA